MPFLPLLAAVTPLLSSVSQATVSARPNYDLHFDTTKFAPKRMALDGVNVAFRAYENIVYVEHPVDTRYQTLNIYVPEAYYQGQSVNGYTLKSAPIFFPNSIGGYMPGAAQAPGAGMDGRTNTLLKALKHGYVVVAPGARGRTLKNASGQYTGKAPAAIVDLKAAVRYLKFNRQRIPGNTERIVSNGTSAGGAMSALLGASGNSRDYLPFLNVLSAAKAKDDVWAVSAYCPITNLENADTAYEWLLNGVNESKSFGRGAIPLGAIPPGATPPGAPSPGTTNPFGQPSSKSGPMTAEQIANSAILKGLFPAYLNGLNLKTPNGTHLTLDASGNGPFKEYVKSLVVASAQTAQQAGTDVSQTSWVKTTNGKVTDIDWDTYVRSVGRMKQTSAFDALDLSTGENNEFGTLTIDNQHFTAFGMAHNTVPGATLEAPLAVKMMNPMPYIRTKGVTTSRLWRIRHGAIDRDTSLAIPTILATTLSNRGFNVDFAVPWNVPHSGDYDLDQLFAWIDGHAK